MTFTLPSGVIFTLAVSNPVDDAFLMSHRESFGDLPVEWKGFIERKRTREKSSRRAFLPHQLQHQEMQAIGVFHSVDGGDVGVIESGEKPGLSLESSEALAMLRELLQRTLITTSRPSLVSCGDRLSMPLAPIGFDDLVSGEAASRRERHGGNDRTSSLPNPWHEASLAYRFPARRAQRGITGRTIREG